MSNCSPPRDIKDSLFYIKSRSDYTTACFAYCLQFCLSVFCLSDSFNFIYPQTSANIKWCASWAVYQIFVCDLMSSCLNISVKMEDVVIFFINCYWSRDSLLMLAVVLVGLWSFWFALGVGVTELKTQSKCCTTRELWQSDSVGCHVVVLILQFD